ncbi:MAG: C4-type zinc ribbon domain-containing protein [Verrucomicrobiae bacterium]|nr:C4-type zinc ribbon domain-containing protein [Verrucomicrobiae bacterium]
MNQVTSLLIELCGLEDKLKKRLSSQQRAEVSAQAEEILKKIPLPIQGHYGRLRDAGKRPLAEVVNGICKGCFLTIPYGDILRMKDSNDIHICDHCGRYIYVLEIVRPEDLEQEEETPEPPSLEETVRPSKSKKANSKPKKVKSSSKKN